jgi:ATP-dependent DNA helicase RecG
LSRFFAGRFSSRGWQEQQKRLYPVGAMVAASGLVKKNKYGTTLDNAQLEVLDQWGVNWNRRRSGEWCRCNALTEGVVADVVRKAVMKVLPFAEQLPDPLPAGLKKNMFNKFTRGDRPDHFPPDRDVLAEARRRLVFDEFFYLQLGLLHRRQAAKQSATTAV